MGMTPEKWNVMIGAGLPAKQIKARVGKEARAHLATLALGETITTNQLVEALYPRAVADQSRIGDDTRNAIYKFIGLLAREDMADCCMKGEVSGQFMGRPKRPWLWFSPPEQETCCMCGQVMPAAEDA